MKSQLKEWVIPKEDAVFRLDKNGIWHGQDGKIENQKIIRLFNASIKKDERGYHLCRVREEFLEKVYFPYEDTVLFAIDIKKDAEMINLTLNTREVVHLDPERLFLCNDDLYTLIPDHCIKFSQRALVKISAFMEDNADGLYLNLDGVLHEIPEKEPGWLRGSLRGPWEV